MQTQTKENRLTQISKNCQTQKELLRFRDYIESNISYQLTMCMYIKFVKSVYSYHTI